MLSNIIISVSPLKYVACIEFETAWKQIFSTNTPPSSRFRNGLYTGLFTNEKIKRLCRLFHWLKSISVSKSLHRTTTIMIISLSKMSKMRSCPILDTSIPTDLLRSASWLIGALKCSTCWDRTRHSLQVFALVLQSALLIFNKLFKLQCSSY